jgi:hypothetical protein
VFTALVLLVLLIEVTPAIVFADGPITYGIVALAAAVALAIISITVRSGEVAHLVRIVRLALLLLSVPAVWMLVQLFPMPVGALSNPVWVSTGEALGRPVTGHISIDLGSTSIGLIRYLTAVALFGATTAVTVDRARAEWLLYWLTAGTAFLAAVLVAHHLLELFPLAGSEAIVALHAASALGSIIAAATIIRAIERYETRRNKAEMTWPKFVWSLLAGTSAFVICWLALILAAPLPVIFAAVCGFATVVGVVIVRRFALGPFSIGALFTVAIIAAIAISDIGSSSAGRSPIFRFAAKASPSEISIAERMIADNSIGTGAGTFRALLPSYRDIDAIGTESAPTTAAQVTIEMGGLALWIFVLMMTTSTGLLLRGAMSRGRDSFYAIGAAGALITLTLEAFVDASLLETAIVILATTFLGLGLAQSASRTAH